MKQVIVSLCVLLERISGLSALLPFPLMLHCLSFLKELELAVQVTFTVMFLFSREV